MTLLTVKNLTKSFGGLMAVADVSFEMETGSILGLIGPNGAGKTTVFNLITGLTTPDKGSLFFMDKSLKKIKPHKIVEMGLARTFQTIRLFPNLTVLENVLAGCHCRMKSGIFSALFRLPRHYREEKKFLNIALTELEFVGLLDQVNNLAKNLSYGDQRLLEIARALATNPKLIILDEPAGGMNEQETDALRKMVLTIRDRGISVFLIEHDIAFVMQVCDQLVVLENGALIAHGTPFEVKQDPKVIEAYLGVGH